MSTNKGVEVEFGPREPIAVDFLSVDVGEVFTIYRDVEVAERSKCLYMKTTEILSSINGDTLNAVDLFNGELSHFSPGENVYRMKGELKVDYE